MTKQFLDLKRVCFYRFEDDRESFDEIDSMDVCVRAKWVCDFPYSFAPSERLGLSDGQWYLVGEHEATLIQGKWTIRN